MSSPTSPRGDKLRADLISGLTVALVGLPQCLAYAMMSGMPPAYGLATAAVPGLVAALAGKSPHVITGPTNTTGLLILAALGPWLGENGLITADGLGVLATLALLAGAVRLVAAFAGGAWLIRFLPESVLVGFTAGAGILIAVMQLDEALGLSGVRGGSLIGQAQALWEHLGSGHTPGGPAVLVTLLTAVVIAGGKKIAPRLPLPLLAVVGGGLVAWVSGLDAASGLPLVSDRAAMPSGWPPMALPDLRLEIVRPLLLPAAAITLLGTLELAVTARGGGARPDMRREILAQGWANIAGAFAGAFPASASLTRSMLLRLGGASSRSAAVIAALVVVPILLFGGAAVGAIPQASLAGVLFVIAFKMVNLDRIKTFWKVSPETRTLMLVTGGATLTLPLEWAILTGAGLGLLLHLVHTTAPRLVRLRPEGGRLVALPEGEGAAEVVLEVSGDLHYAAVETFLRDAEAAIPPEARLVVIDLSHAHALRFAAFAAFVRLAEAVEARGGALHLAGVSDDFARFIEKAGRPIPHSAWRPEPCASALAALGLKPR